MKPEISGATCAAFSAYALGSDARVCAGIFVSMYILWLVVFLVGDLVSKRVKRTP